MKNLTELLRVGHKMLLRNSPVILTSIGVAGVATTAVLAATGTVKAQKLVEEKREQINETETFTQYKVEVVKAAAPAYIPAIGVGVLTISAIILAHRVQHRRMAALASVYSLTETAFREYREEVRDTFGERKEKQITADSHARTMKKNPPSSDDGEVIVISGETLCYDVYSGRYFQTDIETIRKAIHSSNHQMYSEDWVSLNDFYDEVGLPPVDLGGNVGWHVEDGVIEESFSSALSPDGRPALVVDFTGKPKYSV